MSWFKCDNDGNILLNMNNILKILQNTSVPDIEKIQTDILSAIQNIKSISASGEISQEQLNLILSVIQAIPSDTIVDNQNVMIDTLNTTKSNTNDIKSILDIVNNVSEESITGTLKAGKTSITLKNNNIKEDTGVEVYTSIYNVNPTAIFTTDGSITLTFDKQNTDMNVKVIFKRNLNWNDIPEKFVTIVDGVIQTKNIDFKLEQCVDENKSTLPNELTPFTYKVQGNVVYSSIEKGKLEISYEAILLDEDNIPLIPDNSSFTRALGWYIKKEWYTILFEQGKISQQVLYNTQQEYAWSVGDCQTEFNRLSIDKAESLANMWKSFIARDNEHSYGFKHTGSRQLIKVK